MKNSKFYYKGMERDARHSNRFELYFSGLGEVYSFTTIHSAPEGFEEFVPYVVALVKLEEGVMITSQLTDVSPDEVYIGLKVEMVTRKLSEQGERGIINYGYKFRPLLSE